MIQHTEHQLESAVIDLRHFAEASYGCDDDTVADLMREIINRGLASIEAEKKEARAMIWPPRAWPTDLPKAPTCEDCGTIVSILWLQTPSFTDHGPQCLKCKEASK